MTVVSRCEAAWVMWGPVLKNRGVEAVISFDALGVRIPLFSKLTEGRVPTV